MKKISLLLTLMMLISAFSFTNVMAAENDYLCYDDFSDATIYSKWTDAAGKNGFSVVDEHLQVNEALGQKIARSDMTTAITTGVVKLELDYKFVKGASQYIGMNKSNGGSAAQLYLVGGDGSVRYGEEVLTGTKTNSEKYLTAGNWYHIEIEYDLDFNKMAIQITDNSNGSSVLKVTDLDFDLDVRSPYFYFATGTLTAPIGIDNVKVYPIDEISLDDIVLNKAFTDVNDDFSDATNHSKWTDTAGKNGFSVVDEYLQVNEALGQKISRSDMTTAITTGVVKLELDYKFVKGASQYIGMNKSNGGSAAQLYLVGGDGSVRYGEEVLTGTKTNSEKYLTAGNWYHIEIEYDLDFNKMAIQITDNSNGSSVLKVTDLDFDLDVRSPYFYFATGTLTTPIGIDNVSFSAVNPTVNATLSNGTDTYTDLAKVPVDATELTIDFGTAMHTGSVDSRRVALKKADGTFVSATGAWTGNNRKYVLTLNEDLTPGAEYTLFVSEKVVNVNCVGLGRNDETVIKIDPGKLTVAISDVKSGETSVANTLANFTGAVTPELTVTNTTGKEHTVNVIYAYYTANGLKTVPVDNDVTIAADGTVTGLDAHTIYDLSDVKAVKIMVWSDMTNIEPLCTVYEIK